MKQLAVAFFCLLIPGWIVSAASPDEVNKMAGIALFGTGKLWDESPEAVVRRLQLKFTDGGGGDAQRIISAQFRNRMLFSCPASEIRIFTENGRVSRIDLVLLNKGDNAGSWNKNSFRGELRKSRLRLERILNDRLGRSRREFFGTGDLGERLPSWRVGEHVMLLDFAADEYLMLHIVPESAIDNSRRRVSDEQKAGPRSEYSKNVVRDRNGDVRIDRVPMVDQGDKGYCVPATVERVARYFGIVDVDMHKLAEKFRTGHGGGTLVNDMMRGTRRLLGDYGLRMKETNKLRFRTIREYVDQGIPLLWFHFSTPEFNQLLKESISFRNRIAFDKWKAQLSRKKRIRKGETGAHVALLIGYNPHTEEVAVSNSWGKAFSIAWVRLSDMERVDGKIGLFVVTPRR